MAERLLFRRSASAIRFGVIQSAGLVCLGVLLSFLLTAVLRAPVNALSWALVLYLPYAGALALMPLLLVSITPRRRRDHKTRRLFCRR